MNVNDKVAFVVVKGKSKKGNDFYALAIRLNNVDHYITFINKSEYDKLVDKKGE